MTHDERQQTESKTQQKRTKTTKHQTQEKRTNTNTNTTNGNLRRPDCALASAIEKATPEYEARLAGTFEGRANIDAKAAPPGEWGIGGAAIIDPDEVEGDSALSRCIGVCAGERVRAL